MTTPVQLGVYGLLSLFSAMVMGGLNGATTYAMDAPESNQPSHSQSGSINVTPWCSDAAAETTFWRVNSQRTETTTLAWDNFENDISGTYDAPTGESVMQTAYVASDLNNTTRFTYDGGEFTTNAPISQCAPVIVPPVEPEDCVDGAIQDNLIVSFLSKDTASISTRDGKLLCEDVTVFFSSYVMPATYNGQGFENNPTAHPQYIHGSTSAVLEAGTTGTQVLMVNLPDRCQNIQIDVYYAPEIREVGPNGHGTQNILSDIIRKAEDCPTGGNGGGGGDTTTPPPATQQPAPSVPVVPVVAKGNGSDGQVNNSVVELPAELPRTGSNANPPYMFIGLLLALLTYAFAYRFNTTSSENG